MWKRNSIRVNEIAALLVKVIEDAFGSFLITLSHKSFPVDNGKFHKIQSEPMLLPGITKIHGAQT